MMLGQASPDMSKAMKASVEALKTYLDTISKDKKLADAHARYIRLFFESLLATGFSEEQALRIVTGAPMPGAR